MDSKTTFKQSNQGWNYNHTMIFSKPSTQNFFLPQLAVMSQSDWPICCCK